MNTWSDISPLLLAIGIAHRAAEIHEDVLSIQFGKVFLQAADIVPLLEVAGQFGITLILLYYKGLCFRIAYFDYIDIILRGGSIEDFIKRWSIADAAYC